MPQPEPEHRAAREAEDAPPEEEAAEEETAEEPRAPRASGKFGVESLEPRILMSATWVEAELGEEALEEALGDDAGQAEAEVLDGLDSESSLFDEGELASLEELGADSDDGDDAAEESEPASTDVAQTAVPSVTPTGEGFTAGSLGEDEGSRTVVFLDRSVPELDEMIADLDAQIAGGRDLEYVVIEADQDGIAVVSETLAGMEGVDAVHVVSHGDEGSVTLGSAELDGASLSARADEVAAWGHALDADGDLLLYGCDLAGDAGGEAFLEQLAELTRADVAASDDRTGGEESGGDWELEHEVGDVDEGVVFSAGMRAEYAGALGEVLQVPGSVAGTEDQPVELPIALDLEPGQEATSIVVAGVPEGASLNQGTDNGDGTWTLTPADLDGLELLPAPDSDADFALTVTVETSTGSTATTIDRTNATSTGNGFTVSGRTIQPDGTLSDADPSHVTLSSSGIGVAGDTGGPGYQLGHDVSRGLSEELHVEFDTSVEHAEVEIERAFAGEGGSGSGEQGHYQLFEDGVLVGEGTFAPTSGHRMTLSLSVPGGGTFDQVVFTATDYSGGANGSNDSSDYLVKSVSFERPGDSSSESATIQVSVASVADAADLTANDVAGSEDTSIALDLAASVTDDSETITAVTVTGVPEGATLSAGVDHGDGTWSVDPTDLDGLALTPPQDFSGDMTLGLEVTTEDGGDSTTTSESFTVSVAGVADVPQLEASAGDPVAVSEPGVAPIAHWTMDDAYGSVTVVDASGSNDGESRSTISGNRVDFDPGEGHDGGGAVEFDPADRTYVEVPHDPVLKPESGALTLWIKPDDVDGLYGLASTDSMHYDDGGHFTAWVADGELRVRLQGTDIDTTIQGGSVQEGAWQHVAITWGDDGLQVFLDGGLVASDPSWTGGLGGNEEPWVLGANQWASGDGVADELRDFYDGQMDDVALYGEQLDAAQIAELVAAGVEGLAAGEQHTEYALDVATAAADGDGSEDVVITVAGLPEGAALSAGTDNGDGSWTLEPAELDGLTLSVPSGGPDSFELVVTSTATEADGDTQTASTTLTIGAAPIEQVDASGVEDTAIPLTVTLPDVKPDDEIVIGGVPDGAVLSAGVDNGDGTWTLTPAEADGLTVTPPADSDLDFDLTVTLRSTDVQTTTGTIDTSNAGATGQGFTVEARTIQSDGTLSDPSADHVLVTSSGLGVSGSTGGPSSQLGYDTNRDVSEELHVRFDADVGSATVEVGMLYSNEGGSAEQGRWQAFQDGVLVGEGLFAPTSGTSMTVDVDLPAGTTFDQLVFSATEFTGGTDGSGNSSDYFVRSITYESVETTTADRDLGKIHVEVVPDADAAAVVANDVSGSEDSPIALDLTASVTDDSETITGVVVTGVPAGGELSHGTDNGDGTWTVDPADLGSLEFTAPENFSGTVNLGVDVTTTDGTDTETTNSSFTVTVGAVADEAAIVANDVSGAEDSPIGLDLTANVTDDSETITGVVVTGVPSGGGLSHGTDNGDGTWTVDLADLGALKFTPPENFSGTVSLGVDVTTTDGADTETTSSGFTVTVTPVADEAVVVANDVRGDEDTPIRLDVATGVGDDSESVRSVVVTGVPAGALLSHGVDHGDGTWSVDPDDVGALELTPPEDFSGTIELGLEVTTEDGADAETVSTSFSVTVDPVADGVNLGVDASSGTVGDPIPLGVTIEGLDVDGSEHHHLLVDGLPPGVSLTGGERMGDGTWRVPAGELEGLAIVTDVAFEGADLSLEFSVVSTDGSDTVVTTFAEGPVLLTIAPDEPPVDTTADDGEAGDNEPGSDDGSDWPSEQGDADLYEGVSFEEDLFAGSSGAQAGEEAGDDPGGAREAIALGATPRMELPDPGDGLVRLFALDPESAAPLDAEGPDEPGRATPAAGPVVEPPADEGGSPAAAAARTAGIWTLVVGLLRNLTGASPASKHDDDRRP